MDKPIAEDLKDGYAAMNRNDEHEDWVAQLIERTSAAEAARDEARAANELDRRSLHAIVRAIEEEINGRMWLIEGRGPYEWDDDKYRKEFGWAVHVLQEKLEPLRKIAGDLKNCPQTEDGVNSVRKLERERDEAQARVKELEAQVERLTRPVTDEEWAVDNWKESGGSMRGFADHFIAARATAEKEKPLQS